MHVTERKQQTDKDKIAAALGFQHVAQDAAQAAAQMALQMAMSMMLSTRTASPPSERGRPSACKVTAVLVRRQDSGHDQQMLCRSSGQTCTVSTVSVVSEVGRSCDATCALLADTYNCCKACVKGIQELLLETRCHA